MMEKRNKALLGAAVAGILGGVVAMSSYAADKKVAKSEVEHCYGINSCKATGQCGGKGHGCAGKNDCKGMGWINVEKGHCKDVQGGSLTLPMEEKK